MASGAGLWETTEVTGEALRASWSLSRVLSSAVTGSSITHSEWAWPRPQHSHREAARLGPRVLVYQPQGLGTEVEFRCVV